DETPRWSVDEAPARSLSEELGEFVAARLPAYMRPARIAICEQLPLTANGKVDRAELVRRANALALDPSSGAARFVNPREELVAEMIADLLGREHVGPDDDFF